MTLRNCFLMTVLMSVFIGFTSGCSSTRGLENNHAELVAWYIEDVVRGTARQPTELQVTNSNQALERVAGWLLGGDVKGTHIHPNQIQDRMRRWSALRTLFIQGHVVVLQDGLVAPAQKLLREDKAYVLPVVDAENQDRRSIDALIISMSDADRPAARQWLDQAAKARVTLDKQAGAQVWLQPANTATDPRIRITP